MSRMTAVVPAGVDAPAQARRFCSTVCREWGVDGLTDLCALLVSELVTNAVVHGSGPVGLELRLDGGVLRVSVAQEQVVGLPEPLMSGSAAISGRGLAIVDRMAAGWGAETDDGGTTVWFDLVLSEPPGAGGRG